MDTQSSTEFETHGIYCITNAISYEIQLSPDGSSLRARRKLYDDVLEISEYTEIEDMPYDKRVARNVFGFDIDVAQVFRVHRGVSNDGA